MFHTLTSSALLSSSFLVLLKFVHCLLQKHPASTSSSQQPSYDKQYLKSRIKPMFEIIYIFLFFLMLAEVAVFLIVNLPVPKVWKSAIFGAVYNNPWLKNFLKVQLLLVVLAGIFYMDLVKQEKVYTRQKKLNKGNTIGAELKEATLSYKIIKIQRNKYISGLVIFTFLVTIAFFWLKQTRFELETKYKEELMHLRSKDAHGEKLQRQYSTFSVEESETKKSV